MDKISYTVEDCFSSIKNGVNIKQDKGKRGYPITRIESTSNGLFNRDRLGYAGIEDITPYQEYILEDGDLLMSHINSFPYLGRVVYYAKLKNETIIHGVNLLRLKAIKTRLRPRYATFLFSSVSFKNKIHAITKKSVNQASFSISDLKKIRLDLPTVEQQDEIVSRLAGLHKIIELRRAQLAKLDELVKCRFVEMFGDPLTTPKYPSIAIRHIGDVMTGTTPSMKESKYYDSDDIMFIKPSDIAEGQVTTIESSEAYISESARAVGRIFPEKSVLVTCIGTIGKVGVSTKESSCNQQINVIVPYKQANYLYLAHTLLYMRDYLKEQKNAPVVPILNKRDFSKITLPMPSLSLQEQFATFVDRVDKLRFVIQKSLDETQMLFDSLMQDYFD